jgi:hypothetical protein
MKKLLILSVLLGLMALPMFASDFSWGGDLTTGYTGDFGDNYTKSATITFDVKAAVDDYNSLVIEIDLLDGALPDVAKVTTDVGMWLGLPVGIMLDSGWDDPDANEFHSISEYDNEEVFDFSTGDQLGFALLVTAADILEVELAFNPTGTLIWDDTGSFPGEPGELLAGLAVKEPIPGLNAEVYYYQGESAYDEFGEGQIMFDAAYSTEVGPVGLDAGAAFFYNLDAAALGLAYDWAFGVAAAAAVMEIADITLGLAGTSEDFLDNISASVVVDAIEQASLFAGLWYDVAVAEELAEAEFGVNLHMGAAELYLGYLVDNGGTGDHFNAPPNETGEDVVFVKFDIDY